ncbi:MULTISPECIES: ImmA/IrrE family metallo-endopeptidase [Morganellaceae]|uniref:DNA-binding protein n=1 Tax=Moellerella wisconsensis ATCC 35017 TaxID=1354267 RepID=A0A0N0I9E9_9GAMM|nr:MULTISPECIES: ImmA/IrrE family metallo-endopeptidase [Morganellaceae]KPD01980.1 DNA-binding protein [Moellerella wisconsensis ATCC 35017]VFS54183.1 Domain of uncharacterised function (DUF955) [Moellerella wisconsensis]
MATIELKLSPKIIEWIADKQGVSTLSLAQDLTPKKQDHFLEGKVTKGIAEKLAKLAGIPFGYLFLDHPPVEKKLEIPDFRRSPEYVELSRDFTETYKDVLFKVDWYKDYLKDVGADIPLPFIGKYTIKSNAETVSKDIASVIGFDIEAILKKVRFDSYFGAASKLIENAGILVFKNGIVKNSTKRKLNIDEFRGFSIVDPVAPAVFVNGADSFSAQIFTLFHEVAHIWIGKGGISDWDYENKIEAFCNKVAAYILMPDDLYIKKWKSEAHSTEENIYINRHVSKFFKVSEYACAIKAKDLGLIDDETFVMIRRACIRNYNSAEKKSDGGSPYYTIPYRNSNKITDAVLALTMSQSLPIREAGRILNIKADTVIELYKKRTSR